MTTINNDYRDYLRRGAISCTAGICGSVIGQPFDYFKTMRQTGNKFRILQCYTGTSMYMAQQIPKNVIRLGLYNTFKANNIDPFWAGMTSGLLESFLFVSPLENIKLKMQTRNTTVLPTIRAIIRDNGIRGFYHGAVATSLRSASNLATNYGAYNMMRNNIMKTDDKLITFGCSMLATSIGPILNNPIDYVKTCKQTRPSYTLSDALADYRNGGVRVFYKGLPQRLMKLCPEQAVVMTVFENLNQRYGKL